MLFRSVHGGDLAVLRVVGVHGVLVVGHVGGVELLGGEGPLRRVLDQHPRAVGLRDSPGRDGVAVAVERAERLGEPVRAMPENPVNARIADKERINTLNRKETVFRDLLNFISIKQN